MQGREMFICSCSGMGGCETFRLMHFSFPAGKMTVVEKELKSSTLLTEKSLLLFYYAICVFLEL